MKVREFVDVFQSQVPLSIAEDWDNVGLLSGDFNADVKRVAVTLDVTRAVVDEAAANDVDLIVTHHPIPFKPLRCITSESQTGRILLASIRHEIAIFSAHTAWDNAVGGINDQYCELLGLTDCRPLIPKTFDARQGASRVGRWREPRSVGEVFELLGKRVKHMQPRASCEWDKPMQKVVICCGSGGSMISQAISAGADGLVTGEATYHQCLEASQHGVCLLMIGHHASEHFAMHSLAAKLVKWMPQLEVMNCKSDRNIIHRS